VGYANGVDVDPALLVHRSFAEGIVNAVAEFEPSFVLIGQAHVRCTPTSNSPGEAVTASTADPVALVVGEVAKIRGVMLLDPLFGDDAPAHGAARIAKEVAARLGGKNVTVSRLDVSAAFSNLAPGQVAVAAISDPNALAVDPPEGAGVVVILRAGT
jgi:hypothetical protein